MSAKDKDEGASALSIETEGLEHSQETIRRSHRSRRTNVTLDVEGVYRERLVYLNKCKSGALATVTAKRNEIERLMQDIKNYEQVKDKATVFTEMFGRYMEAQQKLILESKEKDQKLQAIRDFDETIERINEFEQRLNEWLVHTELIVTQHEVQPSDSASQFTKVSSTVMNNSSVSRVSSARSAISIARVEESAKIAELEAEAKVLKQRQALQEKERQLNEDKLKLALEKEELHLKTELAKAQARESVFAQAEVATNHVETLYDANNETVPLKTLSIRQEKSFDKVFNSKALKSEVPSSRKIKESPYNYEGQREQPQITKQRSHIVHPEKGIRRDERGEIVLEKKYDKDQDIFQRQNRIMEELVIQQQRATLPRRGMLTFSGDVTQYRTFCRAFETLIKLKEPDPASKLYYLEQFTTGRAQELVRSCLHMTPNEGYKKAWVLLEQKFGQKHNIAIAHVDQLIKGNPIKSEDGEALEQFSIKLMSCSNTLKAIGCMNKIENPDAMKKLIERLPYKLQERWRDTADKIMNDERREITIEDISKFVEQRARSLNNPVFGKLSFPSKDQYAKSRNSKVRQTSGNKPTSFATQVKDKDLKSGLPKLNPNRAEAGVQTESVKTCLCCDKNHKLTDCPSFEKRPYSQRLDFAMKHRLCFACLNGGHQSKACFKKKPCKTCSGKHSTLLITLSARLSTRQYQQRTRRKEGRYGKC